MSTRDAAQRFYAGFFFFCCSGHNFHFHMPQAPVSAPGGRGGLKWGGMNAHNATGGGGEGGGRGGAAGVA